MIFTPKVRQIWRCIFFMSRKKKNNTKYSPEFKIAIIKNMRENHLSYRDTVRLRLRELFGRLRSLRMSGARRGQVKAWRYKKRTGSWEEPAIFGAP